jgi:hypothetical protein
MMNKTLNIRKPGSQRAKFFGIVFFIIGMFLSLQGGIALYKLYQEPDLMTMVGRGLSPEKGQNWAKLLSGVSVIFLGIALMLTSDKKKKEII